MYFQEHTSLIASDPGNSDKAHACAGKTKEVCLQSPIEIEDIRSLRRLNGIEDVELETEIRGLRVGDSVNLTFQTGTTPCVTETLAVRVINIRDCKYRGKLVKPPRSTALSELGQTAILTFAACHIHSIAQTNQRRLNADTR
jgi:hypothetical protein